MKIINSDDYKYFIAYIRVSKKDQDTLQQRKYVCSTAYRQGIKRIRLIEVHASCFIHNQKKRKIEYLLKEIKPETLLLVSEISRIGRDLRETINLIYDLVDKNVGIWFMKENLLVDKLNKNELINIITISIGSMIAQVDNIYRSKRTKDGLQRARERGVVLGQKKKVLKCKSLPYVKEIVELRDVRNYLFRNISFFLEKKYGVTISKSQIRQVYNKYHNGHYDIYFETGNLQ